MTEAQIEHAIRLVVGQLPDVVLWRNSTGAAKLPDGRWVRYGLCVGGSDLIGIAFGRFLALEVKRPGGRATPEQLQFLALVDRLGGVGAIVHSVDEAMGAVERAKTLTSTGRED
jgi:hypothetical protein